MNAFGLRDMVGADTQKTADLGQGFGMPLFEIFGTQDQAVLPGKPLEQLMQLACVKSTLHIRMHRMTRGGAGHPPFMQQSAEKRPCFSAALIFHRPLRISPGHRVTQAKR